MPPKFSKEIQARLVSGYLPNRQHRTSPCEAACPAGNPIQAMETLLKDGLRDQAHAKLLSRNPFPGVTGRVCSRPCEEKCNRGQYDESLAISALERFAADSPASFAVKPGNETGKRVAIVGSGPAGLTCAYFLRLLGHSVDIFEAGPMLGGIPRLAVPDFRLPKNVPDREAGNILALGVIAHTNVKVGETVSLKQLRDGFDACVLAVGNMHERCLEIPGADKAILAVDFLTRCNLSRQNLKGKNVVIAGGGGVAFDCGFTALRLGAASVSLVFPETEDCIRASADEVAQARREGLKLYLSRLVTSMDGGVKATGLESFCFDETGCLHANARAGDIVTLEADMIICASGLMPSLEFLESLKAKVTPQGFLIVDENMATSVSGLFAAGDIVTGPSSVASAVGSGRKAALGVHKALLGLDHDPRLEFVEQEDGFSILAVTGISAPGGPHVVEYKEIFNPDHHDKAARQHVREALSDALPFAELNLGFAPEAAQAEAGRCMHCGHCISCGICIERCPGLILEESDGGPWVKYPDECWHCGCCRIGCPTGAISIEFPITMLV